MALRFIDWHRAFLPSLVETLITPQVVTEGVLDLSDRIIVLPGARAGRRLLELLTIACHDSGLCFSPPRLITPSQFLESLIDAHLGAHHEPREGNKEETGEEASVEDLHLNLASDHDLLVAWHGVLSELSPEVRSLIIAKELDSSLLWSDAATFVRLQRELLGGGYSFKDVSISLADSLSPTVGQQWSLLADLEELVEQQLQALNLVSAAKILQALAEKDQITISKRCIIAAVVDAQPIFFTVLKKLSPSPDIYCFCSPTREGDFDELGRLKFESWSKAALPITDSQIASLATPRLEAQAVALKLYAHSGDSFHEAPPVNERESSPLLAKTITICAADQAFMPLLSAELKRWKIPTHFNPGWSLADSHVLNLIKILASYTTERSIEALSQLVRHPEFGRYLTRAEPFPDYNHEFFLTRLDTFISESIPLTTKGLINDARIAATIDTITDLVGELFSAYQLTVADWCLKVERLIKKIFGASELQINIPSQRLVAETCIALFELLRSLFNSQFATKQSMNFAEFSSLLTYAAKTVPFSPYHEEHDSIEIVGWLDIVLDDAPNTLITALHEGAIPEMMTSHELLPNSAKRQLGLPCNESRLARDVYIAAASLNSKVSVEFSFHRQSLDHAPLQPSSLLLRPTVSSLESFNRVGDDNAHPNYPLWARVRKLLDLPELRGSTLTDSFSAGNGAYDLNHAVPAIVKPSSKVLTAAAFSRPLPLPSPIQEPPDKVSPSAISAYLQCPYRFYLTYVLELVEQSDTNTEIPSHIIGSIIHKVLELLPNEGRFNLESMTKQILNDWHHRIDNHFSDSSRNIIRLLKEEGAQRLQRAVGWFYQRRLEGWIRHGVEHKLTLGPSPETHGFIINGRVDALEYNPKTHEAIIIDYKLRERSENPTNALGPDGTWRSLTMPIYYHLAYPELVKAYTKVNSLQMAYLNLGPEFTYELNVAKWSEEELESAWRLTLQILGKIKAKEFWPPSQQDIIFDRYQKLIGDMAGLDSQVSDISEG